MENAKFESIACILDNYLYSGGLHILAGISGTGKSSICEIIKKTNKSDAVFFDVQVERRAEIFNKLVSDIKSTNNHIVIDGLDNSGSDCGNIFTSLVEHVKIKKMGVLILTQFFDDISFENITQASTVSLISNLYPRKKESVYLHSVDFKGDIHDKYQSLKEFRLKYR